MLNYHIGDSVWLVWVGELSVLQAEAKLQPATRITLQPKPTTPNLQTHRNKNNATNVVIQHNSRKLLMMDILMSETC